MGVLTLTFEMSARYLNASWWMVDSCMGDTLVSKECLQAYSGVEGERKLVECILVDGGFVHGETRNAFW